MPNAHPQSDSKSTTALSSTDAVVLYHVPPSFYSQVARLVLAEKEVSYESFYALAGPPSYETYEPWYLELNPGGTVPTLTIGETTLDDSRKILHVVDERYGGRKLTPDDDASREEMNAWLDRAYAGPERILAYSGKKLVRLGARVNARRREALVQRREANPQLVAVYDAKIADIDSFVADTVDAKEVQRVRQHCADAFDSLEVRLGAASFIVGDAYTMADLMWTVTVARHKLLGSDPLVNRPALAKWYGRMKDRPSFRQADVWERANLPKMLPVVWAKFRVQVLAVITLATVSTVALAAWLLSL